MPALLIAIWRFLARIFTRSEPVLPVPVTSPTATPKHPPASPFPNISLSGIFGTPPSDSEPAFASPSPFRATPSFHTRHSRSPSTPSSAVILRLDRSTLSPTTMSDGSLEVISLADPDIARLPSPWSPTGNSASSDVWMSVHGTLMNATGPVDNPDLSAASRTAMLSLSTTSLYSSPSVLDAFGISVFVDLDDPTTLPKLNQVRDENRPTLVTQTPRKRRDTLPHAHSHSARSKHLSTPLTKLDNMVDIGHVRSTTSISSMAYELRMGLFADGRSLSAFENILSLLDQASPESKLHPEEAS